MIAAISSPVLASADVNQLTEVEKKDGWRLLFDGKSFEGWRNYKEEGVRDGWKVVDGMMQHTKGGKDLMTVEQFEDFELKIEWRIAEGANSGIFVGVREIDDKISRSGIELSLIHI